MIETIIGVDSSTKTGVTIFDLDNELLLDTKLLHFKEEKGFKRLQLIANAFGSLLDKYTPKVIYIENYGFGNKFTLVPLTEIGTVLRMEAFKRGIEFKEVPPTSLKMYATGNGIAKKPDMMAAAKERFNFESNSDDIVDSYWLTRMGIAIEKGRERLPSEVTKEKKAAKKLKAKAKKVKK